MGSNLIDLGYWKVDSVTCKHFRATANHTTEMDNHPAKHSRLCVGTRLGNNIHYPTTSCTVTCITFEYILYVVNPRCACAVRGMVVGLCVCVCLSACLSTAILALQAMGWLMIDTSGFRTMRSWKIKWWFSWNYCVQEMWHKNEGINLYMLLTTFIQLNGRTYWLYAKIRRFSTYQFLQNRFLPKLELFSLIFSFLALQLTHMRSPGVHVTIPYVHTAPAQKSNTAI